MEKYLVNYAGEKSRVRIWQDAALAAMAAIIKSDPPRSDQLDDAPAGIEGYAKRVARAAYAIADEMHKQHGPSVSSRLQGEPPFVAVESGGTDGEE